MLILVGGQDLVAFVNEGFSICNDFLPAGNVDLVRTESPPDNRGPSNASVIVGGPISGGTEIVGGNVDMIWLF